jgi:hypothetical protein
MFIVFMANDAFTAFPIYALKIKMREINIPPICTFHCILEEPLPNKKKKLKKKKKKKI